MKTALWMTGASFALWLAAASVLDRTASVAMSAGMIGPLAVAIASWVLTERTFRRRPEQLTRRLTIAFGAKMVFFGVYVAVGLRVLSLPTVPFVASFAGYFLALHLAEAFCMRRLFSGELSASR
jgi:hypothetical protein